MIEKNQYLEEFLKNSQEARCELATPEIIRTIERKLAKEDDWNRGTFTELIPGKYGLKRREKDQTIVEVTSIADLYSPDLEISPFVVLYEGKGGLAYVVKDFGKIHMAWDEAKQHEPIRNAIKHMIRRGYGTSTHVYPESPEYIELLINMRPTFGSNLWTNIFLFDEEDKWAMIDFDFIGTLMNYKEIYEGANEGKGHFARLNKIWQKLNSPDYKIG
jgi:hypothetical protein